MKERDSTRQAQGLIRDHTEGITTQYMLNKSGKLVRPTK